MLPNEIDSIDDSFDIISLKRAVYLLMKNAKSIKNDLKKDDTVINLYLSETRVVPDFVLGLSLDNKFVPKRVSVKSDDSLNFKEWYVEFNGYKIGSTGE